MKYLTGINIEVYGSLGDICCKMLPIKKSQCSISSLISFMNSDAVRGPEHCTINSTPPGVSRVLGTDNTSQSHGEQ